MPASFSPHSLTHATSTADDPHTTTQVLISNLLDFKLGDFGVSKHLGQQSETNTFAGTPLSLSLYVLVCIT